MNYHQFAKDFINDKPTYVGHIIILKDEKIIKTINYSKENIHNMRTQMNLFRPRNFKFVYYCSIDDIAIAIYQIGLW